MAVNTWFLVIRVPVAWRVALSENIAYIIPAAQNGSSFDNLTLNIYYFLGSFIIYFIKLINKSLCKLS